MSSLNTSACVTDVATKGPFLPSVVHTDHFYEMCRELSAACKFKSISFALDRIVEKSAEHPIQKFVGQPLVIGFLNLA